MKKRVIAFAVMVSLIVSLSAGCGTQNYDENSESIKSITIATNSESGGLDPSGMIAITYLAYSVNALDELLTFRADGEIDYRAAESYEQNEDATEWTFHLRKDAKWSDGSPVKAEDFRNTICRSLDPSCGNGYSNYLFPIKNAEAIYNGEKTMDQLGLEIPDDNTLVFILEKPCVYFLDLLRLPVYMPSNCKYADAVGSGWDKNPDTSLSNGPFCLKEYVPEQYFVLEKNPYYWNKDAVALDAITFRFFDDQQSMAAAYATGEVDVATSLPANVMEEYSGKEDLKVTENIATRYIYPNLQNNVLQDVRVRKALNLAINREELCKMIGNDTEPTVHFIAKYMKDKSNGEYYADEGKPPFTENVEEARQLLAEAGYKNGEGFPVLTYNFPSLEQDRDTAQVLQQQWKKNLNIDIQLEPQELQVNYAERRAGNFELCRMNWTADFDDPYTYLSMLLSNSTYNCSGIHDETYDAIVETSDVEKDVKKRNELIHQAEQRAVGEQFYIIPLYTTKSCNLIRPNIKNINQIPASGALEYRYARIE